MNWFEHWFDSKYYHILYKKRDSLEAIILIENILKKIKLNTNALFLDLGCGTGRHSIYLNKKGFSVHGVDLSKKSIEQARRFENKKLKFYIKDMRSFCSNKKYDVIVNLFTSFGYFNNDNDNVKVFQNIEKSLKQNGYFILDFLNSEKVIKTLPANETKKIDNITFKIKKTHENNFVCKKISITDKKNNYTFTEKVGLINKQHFINYTKDLNIKLLSTFGDYDLNNYDPICSERLILIFQKQ